MTRLLRCPPVLRTLVALLGALAAVGVYAVLPLVRVLSAGLHGTQQALPVALLLLAAFTLLVTRNLTKITALDRPPESLSADSPKQADYELAAVRRRLPGSGDLKGSLTPRLSPRPRRGHPPPGDLSPASGRPTASGGR